MLHPVPALPNGLDFHGIAAGRLLPGSRQYVGALPGFRHLDAGRRRQPGRRGCYYHPLLFGSRLAGGQPPGVQSPDRISSGGRLLRKVPPSNRRGAERPAAEGSELSYTHTTLSWCAASRRAASAVRSGCPPRLRPGCLLRGETPVDCATYEDFEIYQAAAARGSAAGVGPVCCRLL